ncbi:MAG: hypothetical protein DRJ10_20405 [Bacteroidetes bacterium]|nr:MAG: hypothetical protein DRJ10_20405 [Bacteroidota bacterium]
MNIEKVKNYNQKMLAVLATILVALGLLGLISMSYFFINEVFSYRINDRESGIIANQETDVLQEQNLRKQLISFENKVLVDSVNLVYFIPVKQKNLLEAEHISDGTLGLLNMSGSSSYSKSRRDYYYGSFNNLLIYDYKNNQTIKLFNKRIGLGDIKYYKFAAETLITFKGADVDSDKNGKINLYDLSSLYVYPVNEKKLRKIGKNNWTFIEYDIVPGTKNMMVHFGIDRNEDGYYDPDLEPQIIVLYNFEKDEILDIVNQEMKQELQKLVEGSI